MMAKRYKGILKEDNGTWSIHTRITLPDGSVMQLKRRGFKNQFQAYREKVLLTNELSNKTLILNQNEVETTVLEYLTFICNSIKVTTMTSKQSLFNRHLIEPFGMFPISQFVDEKMLSSFMDNLKESPMSVKHKNRIISEIKKFVTYLYNSGKIDLNSFKNSNLIIVPLYDSAPKVKTERSIWSLEDFKIFLGSIKRDSQDYILFSLWGHTGVRIGEIRALQVRHIDFDLKTLKIEQQASEKTSAGHTVIISPKTKASIRSIVLSDNILILLKDYINELKLVSNDFLFHTSSQTSPIGENTLRRKMKEYCLLSGIKYIAPHGIRHSNTTWLLSGELSLQQIGIVSERLGHNDKSTTLNIYFHINKKSQTELLSLLEF